MEKKLLKNTLISKKFASTIIFSKGVRNISGPTLHKNWFNVTIYKTLAYLKSKK
jgi:hypothetical protein